MRRVFVSALDTPFLGALLASSPGMASEGCFDSGGTKQGAIATLRELGVETLVLGAHPRIRVTSARDFDLLRDAEGAIVGAGDLRPVSRGEALDSLQIAPIRDAWRLYLDRADSRSAVLTGLQRLFPSEPGLQSRSVAIRNTHVSLGEPGDHERALLEQGDEWSGNYTDRKADWHVTVDFEDGRPSEVTRRWFPGPLWSARRPTSRCSGVAHAQPFRVVVVWRDFQVFTGSVAGRREPLNVDSLGSQANV